jgi:uncharacterized protein (TIGR00251 family)
MKAVEKIIPINWIKQSSKGFRITVRATPGSSRSEISGADENWLKVRLKAAPVDGKANKELINFLAKLAKVPKSSIEICSGKNSRLKRVEIRGIQIQDFINRTKETYGINLFPTGV